MERGITNLCLLWGLPCLAGGVVPCHSAGGDGGLPLASATGRASWAGLHGRNEGELGKWIVITHRWLSLPVHSAAALGLTAARCAKRKFAPSETVISCHTSDTARPQGQRIVAVAALLQTQTSAIVTLKASGIESPKQLDGRKYASYEGRFEMPIVQQLIRDDGGQGTAIEVKPGEHGLGIFNTLLSKPDEYHATWVFMPWEGVIARQKGVDLNVFALDGVPYGYTPILVGREDLLEGMRPAVESFLAATSEGYKLAAENPTDSASVVVQVAKHKGIELSSDMVAASARELAPAFLTPSGEWGKMEAARWEAFTKWLSDKGIVTDRSGAPVAVPAPAKLFTNKYL